MKNIFKVFLSAVIAMSVFFGLTFSFSFAKDKLTYNKALSLAEQYIENSLEDEFWKDNNPVVSDGVYFYTDDEDKPSYIEFQATISALFLGIKTEIYNDRPVVMNIASIDDGKHSVVTFGYKSIPTTSNIVRINLGWGKSIEGTYSGQDVYGSNIDQNLTSIGTANYSNFIAYDYTTFNIQ